MSPWMLSIWSLSKITQPYHSGFPGNRGLLKTTLINLESDEYRILRIAGPRAFINIVGLWGILKGSSILAIVHEASDCILHTTIFNILLFATL